MIDSLTPRTAFPTLVRLVVAGTFGVVLPAAGARAQATPANDSLRLGVGDVISLTLEKNPDLLIARRVLAERDASHRTAMAVFSPQVKLSMGSSTDRQNVNALTSNSRLATTTSNAYVASLDKLFRTGIVVSPSLSVAHSDVSGASALAPARASMSLRVLAPLLAGRNGGLSRAEERAAEEELKAFDGDLRQTANQVVANALIAYWEYVSAYHRLDVQRIAEQRASTLVRETETLVNADERSPSDLQPLRANEAAKGVPRINAEQDVLTAREQLGLAIGLATNEIRRVAAPAADFPERDPISALDSANADSVIRVALGSRPDVAAARLRRSTAQMLERVAARETAPRLDLIVGTGYTGFDQATGLQRYLGPVYHGVGALNSSVQLSYQPLVGTTASRAFADQAASEAAQATIAADRATRTAASAAYTALAAFRSAGAELAIAERGLEISQRALESEGSKFKLGMSTRLEVIQAEDAMTSAALNRIQAQAHRVETRVRLELALGTLVAARDAPR